MVIEINKDIDRYKESVAMGLTAKQLIFSVASVAAGGGIVLFLYRHIGLPPSVYVAVPVTAPIALGGFYSFNGMGFYEYMARRMRLLFANRPLAYVSTEGEETIREIRMEKETAKKRIKKRLEGRTGGKTAKGIRNPVDCAVPPGNAQSCRKYGTMEQHGMLKGERAAFRGTIL